MEHRGVHEYPRLDAPRRHRSRSANTGARCDLEGTGPAADENSKEKIRPQRGPRRSRTAPEGPLLSSLIGQVLSLGRLEGRFTASGSVTTAAAKEQMKRVTGVHVSVPQSM